MIDKPKLFLDFDNCMVNSIKAIVDLYNEDYRFYEDYHHIDWWDINTWNFSECNCADTGYIKQYFNQQRFFDRLEFMPWAKEVITILEKIYDITIVSHGYSPNLTLKQFWIKSYFPSIKFWGVNLEQYSDKSCVDMSGATFFDDSIKNLLNSNAKQKICFGEEYSWNSDWSGGRLVNWCDIYRKLVGGDTIVF